MQPFVTVQCPTCWQTNDIPVDIAEGATEVIQDCEVCCNPMLVHVEVDAGRVTGAYAERAQ